MLLADAYQMVNNIDLKLDEPIYSQKQVDKLFKEAGVLTGQDAKIFLNNIENPKELSLEVKERMLNNYNKFK